MMRPKLPGKKVGGVRKKLQGGAAAKGKLTEESDDFDGGRDDFRLAKVLHGD